MEYLQGSATHLAINPPFENDPSVPQRLLSDRISELLMFGPQDDGLLCSASEAETLWFEVKRHRATHLHTDFRLRLFGQLVTWAFYPQPSLNPNRWISAREQHDHSVQGLGVERVVPPGYGAGPMLVWDEGTFEPLGYEPGEDSQAVVALKALQAGRFDFRLTGKRLNGGFRIERASYNWRLRKLDDEHARRGRFEFEDRSIYDGRTLDDIVAEDLRRKSPRTGLCQETPSLFASAA